MVVLFFGFDFRSTCRRKPLREKNQPRVHVVFPNGRITVCSYFFPPFPMTLNKELVQGREAMKIAIPMAEGNFCEHFGGAKEFWLFEGDRGTRSFHRNERFPAPEHKPGSLPNWLEQQKVNALVASAIGERALVMLATAGIRVFLGDRGMSPAELAMACLAGKLPPANRENSRCNGEHHHHDHEGHDCHH
jgi:predicted Fe-Mo cluster-binding NifX family protein